MDLKIARLAEGIEISKRKLVLDMFEEYGFLGAKQSSLPVNVNVKVVHIEEKLLKDPSVYWQLIEKLMYLILTRPNIAYYMF